MELRSRWIARGYPDCRDSTVKSQQANSGLEMNITIETPAKWLADAQTWTLAKNPAGDSFVHLVVERTNTCYLGGRSSRHAWGYGCGPACELRRVGWERFVAGWDER